uniref:Late embryogenesis abundant protein LEA-2 subgroup domain-containing protein n=1 Tax=Oryza nivara TaxID=4536 RepID=A0A0E0HRN0_ORYNI
MAAMIGTLALLAVACSVTVVLSPAHLVFGARVREDYYSDSERTPERQINVTITANNTSKHAKVRYLSMKTEVWLDDKDWVPVDLGTDNKTSNQFRTWWQPPDSSTQLTAGVNVLETYGRPRSSSAPPPPPGSSNDNKDYTVVIKTQVQFRYGPAYTRLYSIIVTCPCIIVTCLCTY